MMRYVSFVAALLACVCGDAGELAIERSRRDGQVAWTNAFGAGVLTIETAGAVKGPWTPAQNQFTSNSVGSGRVALSPSNTFVRLLAVDISTNTPRHFTNLTESYGILETVAGRGGSSTDVRRPNAS